MPVDIRYERAVPEIPDERCHWCDDVLWDNPRAKFCSVQCEEQFKEWNDEDTGSD